MVRRQSCPVRPRSHRLPPGSRSRAGSGADQEGSASRSPRAPTRLPVPHGFCSGAQPRHSPAAATLSRGRDESSECPRSCFPRCGQQRRQKPGNLLSRSEQVRPRGLGLAQTRPPPPRPGPANGRQGGREEEPGVRRGGAGGVSHPSFWALPGSQWKGLRREGRPGAGGGQEAQCFTGRPPGAVGYGLEGGKGPEHPTPTSHRLAKVPKSNSS